MTRSNDYAAQTPAQAARRKGVKGAKAAAPARKRAASTHALGPRPGLTGWYKPDQTPVHGGPYQVQVHYGDGRTVLGWSCWSGTFWGSTAFSQRAAELMAHLRSPNQKRAWRGCTRPSRERAA